VFPLATLATLAGCGGILEQPPPPPYEGVKLTVACPNARTAELVRRLAPAWQARQKARVEVVAGGQQPTRPDVRVIRPAELARLVRQGAAQPLPAGAQAPDSYDWRSLLPLYREHLLLWDTAVHALPLAGEAFVCVWRTDLRHRPADPPATWEDYARIAETCAARGSNGKPGPSLPPLPAGDEELDRLFWTVAASFARRAVPADEAVGEDRREHLEEVFSFHCDQKTGAPRIAEPGFVAALKLLQRLQKCRPAGTAARPEEAFRDGRAVLCLCEASWLVPFQQQRGLRDNFGVCPVPGARREFGVNRVPYLGAGGWLAVVPKDAPHAKAAVDFLQAITGPAASAQAAMEPRYGGGPTRQDQLLRERWDAFDLDGARTPQLRDAVDRSLARHGIKNPALVLRVPDQAERRSALVAQLRRALLENADAAACLAEAARAWHALDEKKGAEAGRADYRISLGLLKQ
jgi:ABC-type glycerol-3-phosphate transport system substrate-binding protein